MTQLCLTTYNFPSSYKSIATKSTPFVRDSQKSMEFKKYSSNSSQDTVEKCVVPQAKRSSLWTDDNQTNVFGIFINRVSCKVEAKTLEWKPRYSREDTFFYK